MTLGELIRFLESVPPETVAPLGFGSPHSYRGYYHDLAFEPVENVTVRSMLDAARSAMGATYEGYKGGEYTMGEWTDVWLANYGDTGEGIGPVLLRYMVGQAGALAEARKPATYEEIYEAINGPDRWHVGELDRALKDWRACERFHGIAAPAARAGEQE